MTVTIYDQNDNPFWREGADLKQRGLFQEALERYQLAYKFNPYDVKKPLIVGEMGELLEAMERYDGAASCYKVLAQFAPSEENFTRLDRVQKKLQIPPLPQQARREQQNQENRMIPG